MRWGTCMTWVTTGCMTSASSAYSHLKSLPAAVRYGSNQPTSSTPKMSITRCFSRLCTAIYCCNWVVMTPFLLAAFDCRSGLMQQCLFTAQLVVGYLIMCCALRACSFTTSQHTDESRQTNAQFSGMFANIHYPSGQHLSHQNNAFNHLFVSPNKSVKIPESTLL